MSSETKSFTDLVLDKGFDVKEALESGKKKLGDGLPKNAYLAQYLVDQGVGFYLDKQNNVVERKGGNDYDLTNVIDMVVDGRYRANLTVITQIGSFPRTVCGDGFGKYHTLKDGATFCEKCKAEVEPIDITIPKYLASDSTDTIPIILASWLHSAENLTGKKVSCIGQKSKDGSLNVSKILQVVGLDEELDEPTKKPEVNIMMSTNTEKPKETKKPTVSTPKESPSEMIIGFVKKTVQKNEKPTELKYVKAYFNSWIVERFSGKELKFEEEWNKVVESGNIAYDEGTQTIDWVEE